jgi:hypothetical protein
MDIRLGIIVIIFSKTIGRGTFGKVKKAINKLSN